MKNKKEIDWSSLADVEEKIGLFLAILGFIGVLTTIALGCADALSPGMLFLMPFICFAFIILGIKLNNYGPIARKADKMHKAAIAAQEAEKQKAIAEGAYSFPSMELYRELEKNGIHNLSSEFAVKKAALLAESLLSKDGVQQQYYELYISPEKLGQYFNEAKTQAEAEKAQAEAEEKARKQAEEEAEIRKLLSEEKSELFAYEKYLPYFGREKRIAMLKDKAEKLRAEYEDARSSAEKVSNLQSSIIKSAGSQREINSGIIGGIANGLAGPGAGVLAALDAEKENEAIREYNKASAMYAFNLSSSLDSSLSAHQSTAKYKQDAIKSCSEEIENARLKVVADDSSESCFEKLSISKISTKLSKTGTIRVSANIKTVENIFLNGKTEAVIDGVLSADIYDHQDTKVGSADIVLPVYGTNTSGVNVSGLCLQCANKYKRYTVKFSPKKLWIIEK